jgi:hypothetical protein
MPILVSRCNPQITTTQPRAWLVSLAVVEILTQASSTVLHCWLPHQTRTPKLLLGYVDAFSYLSFRGRNNMSNPHRNTHHKPTASPATGRKGSLQSSSLTTSQNAI